MTQTLSHETVRVDLGERSYDILIGPGLIARAGVEIGARKPGIRCAVITDRNVAATHLDRLMESLAADGIEAVPLVLEPGEKTKRFDELVKVCDHVLGARLERGDAVIALGGGVIGDLAGFAAAIVRRGMQLRADADNAAGAGRFLRRWQDRHQRAARQEPDRRLLSAASGARRHGRARYARPREFRAGYAEVVKYGLIDRPDFFSWLEDNWREVFSGGPARIRAIATGCQAKADVVAADERETGARALLNLGHTFGHALEAATNYDGSRLVHGEGVAIGMVLAHEFSARMNLASPDDAARVQRHLSEVGLPTRMSDIEGDICRRPIY
jgi:3-dehydroquinate synthase